MAQQGDNEGNAGTLSGNGMAADPVVKPQRTRAKRSVKSDVPGESGGSVEHTGLTNPARKKRKRNQSRADKPRVVRDERTAHDAKVKAEIKARKRRIFLACIADGGAIVTACAASGLSRQTVYDWRDNDVEFSRAFMDAREEAVEKLEVAAYQRARDGVSEPVVQLGKIVMDPATMGDADGPKPLMVTKYPENMAMFMLKSMRPEKYREKPPERHDTTVIMQITPDDEKL